MPATIPIHQDFCANVRARRLQLGLTQQEVADKLGVSQPCYTQIETGRAVPGLDVVERVAKALDIPAPMLLAPVPIGAKRKSGQGLLTAT